VQPLLAGVLLHHQGVVADCQGAAADHHSSITSHQGAAANCLGAIIGHQGAADLAVLRLKRFSLQDVLIKEAIDLDV
jgi:hypothetical protein